MSLSTLNSPPLVAALGGASMYALPIAQEMAKTGAISFATLKGTNAFAYFLQTCAVSLPGRMDGEVAKAMSEANQTDNNKKSKQDISEEAKAMLPGQGRTLVAPAGWAFAIWGPIYLGELLMVTSQLFLPETAAIAPLIRDISIPFSFAHTFQTLWCAAFRPKYKGNAMYISAGLLGATAFSLSKAHAFFTTGVKAYTTGQYLLYLFPLSLHFGWTTAATLVNLNGAFSGNPNATSRSIAIVGHLSVALATALGMFVTLEQSAPVYGGVIAWALLAVADGMTNRMQMLLKKVGAGKKGNTEEDVMKLDEYRNAKNQKLLSRIGATLSMGASIWVAVNTFLAK